MALENFERIMTAIFELEGGFSNDPRDPGGMTNLGVTAEAWAAWNKVPLSQTSTDEMKGLTQAQVLPFYRANYWNMIDGDALPSGIDAILMHFQVNAGGRKAAKELQAIVGATQDGMIGVQTLGMIKIYVSYISSGGMLGLIAALVRAQLTYYQSLAEFDIYGNGWVRRVQTMAELARSLVPAPMPPQAAAQ
jgi:lysozyme family protein